MAMRDRQVLPDDSEEALAEYKVDLICGGFTCQPFSVARKRKGTADKRWLWPEFHRIVRLLRPEYVLLENVPGILASWGGMGEILRDLAQSGYDAEWDCIPASDFGAPHLRYRVFIVAYNKCLGRNEGTIKQTVQSKEQKPKGQNSKQPSKVVAYAENRQSKQQVESERR